jgi:AcrR family transcriptional regulator
MRKKAPKRSAGRPPLASVPVLTSTILEAASKTFLSKGFSATTMRKIAEEAHVSPQTLYARFDDKTKLFEALMESRTTALLGVMAAPFQDDAPPPEALQSFGVTLLSTFLGTDLQQLHQMVIGEAKSFPALAHTFFNAGPGRGRTLLIAYLKKCVASGTLHIDQVEVAAEQFIGSLVGSIVIRSTLAQTPKHFDQPEITNWVRIAVEVFLHAYSPTR